MTSTDTSATEVRVDTEVAAAPDRAFAVFTERIGDWWDPSHHLLDSELVSMTFEPRVGGHVVDRYADGRECRWARVLAFDPPRHVAFSWDIGLDWQLATDSAATSRVEVTFTPVGADRTRVTLVHKDLDRHGPGWEAMRDAVGRGWDLTRFTDVAAGFAGAPATAALPPA